MHRNLSETVTKLIWVSVLDNYFIKYKIIQEFLEKLKQTQIRPDARFRMSALH